MIAGFVGASWWAGSAVSGQTVPRTPPPTFTATPSATPLVQPTNTPLPTATATFPPNVPTPTPQADPVIGWTIDRAWAGPGDVLTARCTVFNRGGAIANGTEAVITFPAWLLIDDVALSQGSATQAPGRIAGVLGSIPPQITASVTVRLRVPQDADPGQNISLSAFATYDRGIRIAQDVSVGLPPALLPNTGP